MKKISWLLIFATLLSCFSLLCYAEPSKSGAQALGVTGIESLDFSRKYGPRAYISPSDLLSKILEGREKLSAAEKEYLDGYFDEYLVYSSALPDSLVKTEINGSSISVSAESYSYTAENGAEVVFSPVYCTVGGTRHDMTNGKAENIAYSEGADVRVYYNGHLPLPEKTVNKLLNFTFNEAQLALLSAEFIVEYNKALAEYNKYVEDAEKYEKDKKKYENYLTAKELYDKAIVQYEENLKYTEIYKVKIKEYNAYVKASEKYETDLKQYLIDREAYEQNQKDYAAYISNISVIRVAMTPLDTIYIPSQKEMGSLYNAMQNNELVTMFEKYKDTLVSSFGVKESDIALIRQYSDNLNVLLTQYKEKRAISEKEAFEFYKANYKQISDLFSGIYNKLTAIISPTIFNLICGKMEIEYKEDNGAYKKKRLKTVLASTYLIACALNDSVSAEGTWKFYADDGEPHTYFFSDFLSTEAVITDTNKANPANLKWVEPVKLIEQAPTLPKKPTEVEKPREPLELDEPIKPREVEKPTPPTPAEKPEYKEEYNTEVIHRAGDILLLLEDKSNPLVSRKEITEPVYYPVELSVLANLSTDKAATVYTKNGEHEAVISDLSELNGLDTSSYSDSRSTYTFYGWSQSPTEYIPLPETLTEGISVYRLYTAEKRTYNITFSVNGRDTVKAVKVGELPSYSDISIHKESDALYDYTFKYFYPPLRRVDENTTYTAEYLPSTKICKITFVYGDESVTYRYEVGATMTVGYPEVPRAYIDGDTYYEFEGWDKALPADKIVTDHAVYTAKYKTVLLASAENLQISVADTPSGYLVSGSDSLYTIDGILTLAASAKRSITILFEKGETTLTIPYSAVHYLYTYGAKNVFVTRDEDGVAVCFTNKQGFFISPSSGLYIRTSLGSDNGGSTSLTATYQNGIREENIPFVISDGYYEFAITPNAKYSIERHFSLSFAESEYGSILSDKTTLKEGDPVYLIVYPNSNYLLDSLFIVNDETGEEISLGKESSFTMPAYNVTVKATFSPVEYKITFNYHDKTETFYCKFGEMPPIPDIPQSFTEGELFYTFIGWSSTISMVTGDATYTAKYYSIKESEIVINNRTALEAIQEKYVVPAIIILVSYIASVSAVIITLSLIERKKKKKREGQ